MPPSGAARREEGFWVAVLPFQHRGADPGREALAEGVTEDIVTGLARFSYLRVISRSSTSRYAGEAVDVRTVGRELGARYVLEGSIRQTGSTLRVVVQLVDATTGAHLWTETYSRTFSPEQILALQDDLVPRIVSTVADWYGVLPHTMRELLRHRDPRGLSPYEAVLRGFGYLERIAAERAVEEAPDQGCALAERAMELNPHHPGWYRFSAFFNAYRQRDYRTALDVALKINMPSYFYTHAALAAAHGQLGERGAAQGALQELLAQKPDCANIAREEFAKWVGPGELLESFLDGLRKAGLEIAGVGADGDPPTSAST